MGWGNTNSDGPSSQSPSASSNTSSGGWGSSSYASNNSSQMSGGYRSDGGSSSGSGWGGQSTANPSVTSQFGSSSNSNSSSSSSAPAAIQSKVEAKVDAKNPTNNDGQPGSLTGQGLAGQVATPNADYWSGATDGWRNNDNYTAGKAGQFGTEEHVSSLSNAIRSGKANEGQIETARAMIAGTNAVKGREAAGGLLGVMGTTLGGPVGGMALGKAGEWGAEKLSDLTSGYKDNAAYNQAKKLAGDDSSFMAKMAGQFSPVPGTSGMVKAITNDYTGGFRQQVSDLNRSMINQGYMNSPSNIQRNGSSSAPGSLLDNMYQTQQPAVADNYSQPTLNYDSNATYYRGSVI